MFPRSTFLVTRFVFLQILYSIWPQVVFSAHLHTSQKLTYPPLIGDPLMQNTIVDYDIHDEEHLRIDGTEQHEQHGRKYMEIQVPTCSYRMGVPDIGYGFAVIGEYLKLNYHFIQKCLRNQNHKTDFVYHFIKLNTVFFFGDFVQTMRFYLCNNQNETNSLFKL